MIIYEHGVQIERKLAGMGLGGGGGGGVDNHDNWVTDMLSQLNMHNHTCRWISNLFMQI